MKKLTFIAQNGRLLKQLEDAGVPYATAQKALRNKDVLVNGSRVKADMLLQAGDDVRIFYNEPPLSIVFESERLLVADKPQGLTSEGKDSLESRVKERYSTAKLCHRLDHNTGGLVLFALDDEAYSAIYDALKERTIRKFYQCVVVGAPTPCEATVRAYLSKDADAAEVIVRDHPWPGAKEIVTAYRTLGSSGALSLLEVELVTGRTHQIRAHLAHIGCPIIGDDKYGDRLANKKLGVQAQELFAVRMELRFPAGSPLSYLAGTIIETKPHFSKKIALITQGDLP